MRASACRPMYRLSIDQTAGAVDDRASIRREGCESATRGRLRYRTCFVESRGRTIGLSMNTRLPRQLWLESLDMDEIPGNPTTRRRIIHLALLAARLCCYGPGGAWCVARAESRPHSSIPEFLSGDLLETRTSPECYKRC
jgi:hypothetical protein